MSAAPTEPMFWIRAYESETDEAFVLGAWLTENRHAPPSWDIDRGLYSSHERALIRRLISRSNVLMAHVPEQADALLGFAVIDKREADGGPVLHYCYVKKDARQLGIATALLAPLLDKAAQYTHLPVTRGVRRKGFPKGWRYNPYIVRSM